MTNKSGTKSLHIIINSEAIMTTDNILQSPEGYASQWPPTYSYLGYGWGNSVVILCEL